MAGLWRKKAWSHLSANSETPYPSLSSRSSQLSFQGTGEISSKYSFSPNPQEWGTDLSLNLVEPDDELHHPEHGKSTNGHGVSCRGFTNIFCLLLLVAGLLVLFVGYPLITYFTRSPLSTQGGFNLGGINGSGQIPAMNGNWGLIDLDTPQSAYTKPGLNDPSQEYQLIFSDEFNTDGRTFYPGDDPYWEAVDLHYWATNNLEWYDPEAITTKGGSLVITLDRKQTHDLNYEGGMMSTWLVLASMGWSYPTATQFNLCRNKFCFTGGYIEASVQLPGASTVFGLWPAIWTMGNLGRAGYGASLEGLWPYTYDACDVGTAPNQTINNQPVAATINGDAHNGGALSFLPGQRLSRCTCARESHPGPMHSDGSFVGRAAPEIDVFEAQVDENTLIGRVSQSAQWAPFDESYYWKNTSDNFILQDPEISSLNTYVGGVTQQATSVVTNTNQRCYELSGGCYSVYGFEYKPGKIKHPNKLNSYNEFGFFIIKGFDTGYITWVADNKMAWTLKAPGVGVNDAVKISARPVPQEPMYLIVNLGISQNFGDIDFEHLQFPTHMSIDYIRVYQPRNALNIGCDPPDFPTEEYINTYIEAYTNPNLTTWVDDYHQVWPKNKLIDQC